MEIRKESKVKLGFVLFLNFIVLLFGINGISHVSSLLSNRIFPLIEGLDNGNAFLLISTHHVIQAIIGLLIISLVVLFKKRTFADFGFQIKGFRLSVKPIIIFSIAFCLVQALGVILYVFVFRLPLAFSYPLTPYNFIGNFLFQVLLSGTSEEIVFRSIVVYVLRETTKKYSGYGNAIFIASMAISSIVFMAGHVGVTLVPFQIYNVNWLQQLTCLAVSLFYTWLLFKYNCIYSCMITHNFLNGFIVILTLVVVSLVG